jgi:hypothetical protein
VRTFAALPPAQLKKIAKKLVPRKAFAPVTFNSGASGQYNGILLALKVSAGLALLLGAFLYDGIEIAPLGEPGATAT